MQDLTVTDMLSDNYDEELELAKAISASLQKIDTPVNPVLDKKEEMRAKRLAALSKLGIK